MTRDHELDPRGPRVINVLQTRVGDLVVADSCIAVVRAVKFSCVIVSRLGDLDEDDDEDDDARPKSWGVHPCRAVPAIVEMRVREETP